MSRFAHTLDAPSEATFTFDLDPQGSGTGTVDASHQVGPTGTVDGSVDWTPTTGQACTEALIAGRFERLGELGVGGMGEVWRVEDRVLGRRLAMKVLKDVLLPDNAAMSRFQREAQATAQLQHPSIVPIHDLGRLADGRPFYTMPEIVGRTLTEAINECHAGGRPESWRLRRLLVAFQKVCEAVAYAHTRGVVHRDLKPANIMLGPFGAVFVLDWGLAKVLHQPHPEPSLRPVRTDDAGGFQTRAGAVAGTPFYMAPEQAMGEVDSIDARTDVYALGAVFFQVITGWRPYGHLNVFDVVSMLTDPSRELVIAPQDVEAPAELLAMARKAMARAQADRYPTAGHMATALGEWLDGAQLRVKAMDVVHRALALEPQARALRANAEALLGTAARTLDRIEPWADERRKGQAWSMQDKAHMLLRNADQADAEVDHLLHAGFTYIADLPEAHAALARRARAAHAAAEAAGDQTAGFHAELRLRQHTQALAVGHPMRDRGLAYLKGDGALTMAVSAPDATVSLFRYSERLRRLLAKPFRELGLAPVHKLGLPMGRYLCVVRAPGRVEARLPVHIRRLEHWDGSVDGHGAPPLELVAAGSLQPADRYVPPGPAWIGAPQGARHALPLQRLHVPGFVIQAHPVSNADYIAFLDDLVAEGRTDEASAHLPRNAPVRGGDGGAALYTKGADGGFCLDQAAVADGWRLDWPVLMVGHAQAEAYAAWWAARTGQAWRLPTEVEWEKAGRGADGRVWPWGDVFDAAWCCNRDSHRNHRTPSPTSAFPVDESPYGVRGLAGNVADWTATRGDATELETRVVRGGHWNSIDAGTALFTRASIQPERRSMDIGFRLARDLTEPSGD